MEILSCQTFSDRFNIEEKIMKKDFINFLDTNENMLEIYYFYRK